MTIRVISGAISAPDGSYGSRLIRRADGPVTLPDKLEARYVGLGVAEYVDQRATSPVEEPLADPPADDGVKDPVDPDDPEDPGEAIDYDEMTIAELQAECDARGISYAKRDNKARLIELLEESDEPPVIDPLGVES